MIQIFHNARCGKSRSCLAFIKDSGKEYEVIKYLETPPTFKELSEVIRKLNISPLQLIRSKEPVWIETFKDIEMTNEEIIRAMVAHPILIERPIVVNGDKAVIARPTENVREII